MLEIFKKYYKLIILVTVIILLLLVAYFVFRKENSPNTQSPTSNEYLSDYKFLQEGYSDEDKYLMLLAKISVENYGTYTDNDPRPLLDLQNQSTPTFAIKIKELIDTASSGSNFATTVDPDSLKLEKNGSSRATVYLDAVTTYSKTNEVVPLRYTVNLVNDGQFWLVDNIQF